MMAYRVELIGNTSDIEAFRTALQPNQGSTVDRDAKKYLQSPRFEQLTDPVEIRLVATKLVNAFNIGRELRSNVQSRVEVGGVRQDTPDGEAVTLMVTTAGVIGSTFATFETPSQQLEAVQRFMERAVENVNVHNALLCYSRDRNRFDLRKVYELIRADVNIELARVTGNSPNIADTSKLVYTKKWFTWDENDDFEAGVNDPNASDILDSRHAVYYPPKRRRQLIRPPKPMTLSQAQDFIGRLLGKWIDSKG